MPVHVCIMVFGEGPKGLNTHHRSMKHEGDPVHDDNNIRLVCPSFDLPTHLILVRQSVLLVMHLLHQNLSY